jgi:hypothetical protein
MGCIGVQFGEETGTTEDNENETSAEVTDATLEESNRIATDYDGVAIDLTPHVVLEVRNQTSHNLAGLNIELGAGENITTFSSITASYAITSSLLAMLPSYVIDNKIYVTISGPNGRVRNSYPVPLRNCIPAPDKDCNRIIIDITSATLAELL